MIEKINNIRSIGALNGVNNTFILTPVFRESIHPVKIRVSHSEYEKVKGDKLEMKKLALLKMSSS